jgi:transposase
MRRSRLSWPEQRRLIERFVPGTIAHGGGSGRVNTTTAVFYFHRLRQVIAFESGDLAPVFGEIEVDESTLVAIARIKRGRGAAAEIPVFGLLKRGGKAHARVIPDVKIRALWPILERKILSDSIVYTDTLSSYNVLDLANLQTSAYQSQQTLLRDQEPTSTTGIRPSVICAVSTASLQLTFRSS